MHKITVFQLRKPVGEEDNEADVVSEEYKLEIEVLDEVKHLLPTLGGVYGKWLEISVD